MKEVEFFEQMALKRLDRHKQKIKNPGLSLMLYANTNSKWIIYLNVKPFRGKKIEEPHLWDLGPGKTFLNTKNMLQKMKRLINWTTSTQKTLILEKTPLKGWKDKLRFGRKYL